MDNISSDAAYYISELNAQHLCYNPLAQGLTIVKTPGQDYWGIVSWFDKIAAYMQTIEIQAAPIITERSYQILDMKGRHIQFNYISKHIYDTKIKSLLPHAPDLLDDLTGRFH